MHLKEGECVQLTCKAGSEVGAVTLWVTATDTGFLVQGDPRMEAEVYDHEREMCSYHIKEASNG